MLELHEKSGIASLALGVPKQRQMGASGAQGDLQLLELLKSIHSHLRERERQMEIHNPGITFKMQCWRCLPAHTLGT